MLWGDCERCLWGVDIQVLGEHIKRIVEETSMVMKRDRQAVFVSLPIFLGFGIGGYFALPFEPPLWLSIILFLGASGSYYLFQGRMIKWLFWPIIWLALGLAAGGVRSSYLDTPQLTKETGGVTISGQLITIEDRGDSGLRIVVALDDAAFLPPKSQVRITVRTTMDSRLKAGDDISFRAMLFPSPTPTIPGAHDFARDNWFAGISAVGYAISDIEKKQTVNVNAQTDFADAIENFRNHIVEALSQTLPERPAAIAAALITGKRGLIDDGDAENMRNAGLAHLLAISGLHMALITGFVYFCVRALIALVPPLALRFSSKKIAAIVAWAVGLGYFFITGQGISPARAFLMVSIAFLAILLDRRPISLRVVAVAALVILLLQPESLLSVSFQMSFAAVTGLVVFFDLFNKWMMALRQHHPDSPWLKPGVHYFVSVLLSTLVAEALIAPFAAYHFSEVSFYGLISNMIAIPIMAFWIMPWLFFGLFFFLFGGTALAFIPAGWGIEAVLSIADTVAHIEGAVVPVGLVPDKAMILVVLGILWFLTWSAMRVRTLAMPMVLMGIIVMGQRQMPALIVSEDASLILINETADNGEARFLANNLRADRYLRETVERIYQADIKALSKAEKEDTPTNKQKGFGQCGALGCVYEHPQLGRLAYVEHRDMLADVCHRGITIISSLPIPRWCIQQNPRAIYDFWWLREQGSTSIYMSTKAGDREGFVDTVRVHQGARPWSHWPN